MFTDFYKHNMHFPKRCLLKNHFLRHWTCFETPGKFFRLDMVLMVQHLDGSVIKSTCYTVFRFRNLIIPTTNTVHSG